MKTIVVVEDNGLIRENICEILGLEGYKTIPAENGQIGWDKLNELKPDLIISDVNMPVMNGLDLLKKIRECSQKKHIPFIFLTVHKAMRELRQGVNYEADDYLAKPFEMTQLLRSVKSQLISSGNPKNTNETNESEVNDISNKMAFEEYVSLPIKKMERFGVDLKENSWQFSKQEMEAVGNEVRKISQRLERNVYKILTDQKLSLMQCSQSHEPGINTNVIHNIPETIKKITERSKDFFKNRLIMDIEDFALKTSSDLFSIAMTELIQNALKFSDQRQPCQIMGKIKSNQAYQITISNQGHPFSQENFSKVGRYKIFDGHIGPKRGMGLGLFNAKRAIELSGGSLSLKSSLANITVFNITYP